MPRGNHANSQTTKATLGLRELLLDGAFKPRERVPELRLVEELGVSRTPLRIALLTLEHEGLLETLPGGGFVVREFTRTDIDDAIELRGVLEGTAARLAAERLESDDELEPLRTCCGELDGVVRAPGRVGHLGGGKAHLHSVTHRGRQVTEAANGESWSRRHTS